MLFLQVLRKLTLRNITVSQSITLVLRSVIFCWFCSLQEFYTAYRKGIMFIQQVIKHTTTIFFIIC